MTAADLGPSGETNASLGSRTARGAVVTVVGQGARILVQLASVIILARLLDPHDYGLFAMVMSIAGIAEIFRDFGLGQAAIQARELSRRQRDNLFWLNGAIGAGVAGCVFVASWPIAAVFGRPELIGLTQTVSVVFLINGLATQYRASLNRNLRFIALATTDIAAAVIGLIAAMCFAAIGLGPYALALQLIVQSTALLLLVVIWSRWLPGLPHRKEPMGKFVSFGWNLVATQLVGYAANNLDTVLIGIRFGSVQLGTYNRAYQLVMNPTSQLQTPATLVALPVLSKLQDEPARFWQYVKLGQIALGYSLVAALGLVAGAAVPVTAVLLGDGWEDTAAILAFMATAAVFNTLNLVAYWVYVSRGITRALFRYSLISLAVKVTCVLVGSLGGVVGVAAGYALAPMLSFPISLWWLSRSTTGVPVRTLLAGILRIAAVAAVAGLAAYGSLALTSTLPSIAQIGVAILAWAGAYALCGITLPAIRSDFRDLLLIRDAFLRRRDRSLDDRTNRDGAGLEA